MKKYLLSLFSLAGFFVAGASAQTLNVQIPADLRSSQPGVNRDSTADMVVSHMVEGLVAFDNVGTVKPLLAERVQESDDGLTYTFFLRKGVKFHNGEPLTAQDVLWSWKHYMDPDVGWRCRAEFSGRNGTKVTDVSAPDDMTVKVVIDKADPMFLSTLARPDCGMTGILNKASVKEDGSWDKPVGTGPFKLGTWSKGSYVELLSFKDYASMDGAADGYVGNKQSLVERVKFLVVPDASAAKAALVRGDLDLIPDITSSDYEELKQNTNLQISHSYTARRNTLLIQTADPLMTKPMRRAIASAIDIKSLVEMVTNGLGKPNNSVIPTGTPSYTSVQQTGWKYDLNEAKKLLQEAGYRGQQISLITNKDYPSMYNAAILTQAMLQQAGINVKLDVMDWATQLDRYNSGKYQMMAFSYSPRFDDALLYEHFMGDKKVQKRKVWDNPADLELLAQALATGDRAKRQPLLDQLHKDFLEDVPMVMLYNGITIDATSNNVQGYTSWPGSAARLWQVSKK
ncbi:peptide ABC transporter substrate-binding protein [Advenella sp. S44]|uniref:ABC transporter substrate-binding protein n=1 Tax=Advenella sp. S44 TaxID=1982755 RepID=UPI000C2B1CD6|nr:ABC transporter substrate-binding protein [Advenella sp. S44]PJX27886.1 peptide ABC transporter substrate-binding protein [Advenella sp. S44]